MAITPSLSMWLKPMPRPTVVVVLPSPSGVGVIAETTTYFARGRSCIFSIASSWILAAPVPYGSRCSSGIPDVAAISVSGRSVACDAISRSDGNPIVRSPSRLSRRGATRPATAEFRNAERFHHTEREGCVERHGRRRRRPHRIAQGPLSRRRFPRRFPRRLRRRRPRRQPPESRRVRAGPRVPPRRCRRPRRGRGSRRRSRSPSG